MATEPFKTAVDKAWLLIPVTLVCLAFHSTVLPRTFFHKEINNLRYTFHLCGVCVYFYQYDFQTWTIPSKFSLTYVNQTAALSIIFQIQKKWPISVHILNGIF